MSDREYVTEMVMSYLKNGNKRAVFIKQQDIHDADIVQFCADFENGEDINLVHHDYALYEMKSAYEPFMSAIRDSYYNYYKQTCSIEEFVENCEVYSLQKDVFVSYIRSGECERKIEVMMSEYDYENERMLESIYSSLRYIASEKKLVFVIGKLHMAPVCVLRFINRIFDRKDNIRFIITYGESFLVKEYCHNDWYILMHKAEENKLFFVTKDKVHAKNIEVPDKFECKEDQIKEYIKLLSNMVLLFAFEDARYYLESIITYVNRFDSKVSDDDRFKILELMGQVYLGMGDCKDALLICEKMVPFFDNDGMHRKYVYNLFSAKAHLLMAETNLTHKFCRKCAVLAEKMKDEILQMNVDVVDTIAGFGSFKELFRCNFTYHVSKEIIERTQKAGNENFLAYVYAFGFDNDDKSIQEIGSDEKTPVYFNKGVEIAQRLDNRNLLLNAYMKNIILYSNHGYYEYVRKMFERRLQIIDKNKPVRIAHTYAGLGYNAIVMEDYRKSEDYLYKCLEILIENKQAEDIAETLYNMFMNYYAAGDNKRTVQCIELLLKAMKLIHIEGLRICNTSKMYGILALAYFKLEEYFDCYYCIDKMEIIMSYVLNKADESIEELWVEDLFLYHLCNANICSFEKNEKNAKEHFAQAYKYMQMHDGIKYYTYADYAIFYSRFLSNTGCEEEGRAVIEEAYEYCSQHNFPKKAAILMAELENRRVYTDMLSDRQLPEKEIVDVCQLVGAKTELEKRKKDIDFLTICHNIMDMQGRDVCEVVMHTMNLIRNSFSFDRLLFMEKDATQNIITYASENVFLKNTDEVALVDFFAEYKVEFVSSRLDKSFQRYSQVINKMGGDEVATIVGIPVFKNGELTRIFVATIDVHRNFTENRKLPDYNDLEVIKCAINQLDEAIARIKSDSTIRKMNSQLEKAAFTDQLTGIYNRMGFDKIAGDDIADTGVVLYMDLDNFKKYNDTYGHDAGDVILKGFASIIKNSIADVGYAIRYGGDEFVVVIPEQSEEFAREVAADIQRQLKKDSDIKNAIDGDKITSSVGISSYENSDRKGLENALKWADKALYYVKEREKGNVATWSQLDE